MDWQTWRLIVDGYKRAGSPYGRCTDPKLVLRWWRERLEELPGLDHRQVERAILARPLWSAEEHLN